MNQDVQHMMALAQSQTAQQQQPVDVGACGPMAYNPAGAPGMAGYGQGGFPAGVAGCAPAPAVPPQIATQRGDLYTNCFVPLGVEFGVDGNGNIYPASQIGQPVAGATGAAPGFQVFVRNGVFWIFGFKSFCGPGVVELDSVITGDSDWNHLLGPTDCATWNTDQCFCPVNWGCVSITNPARITARSVSGSTVVEPFRGSLWGIRASSNYACGPLGGLVGTPYGGMPIGG